MRTDTTLYLQRGDEVSATETSLSDYDLRLNLDAGEAILYLARDEAYKIISELESELHRQAESDLDENARAEAYAQKGDLAEADAPDQRSGWLDEFCQRCAGEGWVWTPEYAEDGEPDGAHKEPCPSCQLSPASGQV